LPEQRSSFVIRSRKHAAIGLAVHLAGFALGFAGEGLILMGVLGWDSGAATLEPLGDGLYGLGLVIVVAVAARAGVPMKQFVGAGIAIGIGIFYKSAVHEVHIASGLGFGLPHTAHIGFGAILTTISVAALAVLAARRPRMRRAEIE
jgi:hypothetical protein